MSNSKKKIQAARKIVCDKYGEYSAEYLELCDDDGGYPPLVHDTNYMTEANFTCEDCEEESELGETNVHVCFTCEKFPLCDFCYDEHRHNLKSSSHRMFFYIRELHKEIKELKSQNKELDEKLTDLKYRPNGIGYEEVKESFEKRV